MLLRPGRPLRALTGRLRSAASALAVAALAACAANGAGGAPSGPLPAYQQYDGRKVTAVLFETPPGVALKLRRDSIALIIATKTSRCRLLFIPACPFGAGRSEHSLDLGVLSRDVSRIQLYFRDHGYYGTSVVPSVTPDGDDEARVHFTIVPGDKVTLHSLAVEGLDSLFQPGQIEKRLPLKVGKPFGRRDFISSADTIRNALLQKGYAYAQVLRNYGIDTVSDVAEASYQAVPGPLVRVDTIIFAGLDRLEEKIARRQLTFREGDVLRASALDQSQRNFFGLELVSYASVEIAPDSMQLSPDSLQLQPAEIGSTVLVRIVEAARFMADVSAGIATQDCFRSQVTHVDRNFLGGARRLELNAAVSKLGVGSSGGLENTFLCRGLQTPDSASRLDKAINTSVNYRLAANFLQPRFFGTHTSVTAGGHLEQTSEIGLYLRHSAGAQLGVARRVAPRTVVSGSLNAERGNTDARDVFYCRALQVCDPAAIGPLKKPRWSNSLSVGAVHNATRGTLAPTSGFQARTQLDLASRVLRSDDSYLRLLADGALYRQVRTGWILSGRLMGGTFISGLEGPNGYIPPERRFYGGGANSVRGFATNALGPTVYVIDRFKVHHPKGDTVTVTSMDTLTDGSATGGRRTVLASAELTMPSPFLASYFRFATFVDAGQVWDPPTDSVVSHPGLRVTPGVGLRIATPVGPIRLDVAYNPYGPEPGPLYAIDPAGGLFRVKNRYVPPQRGGFLRRHLAFQVAVGSPF